MPKFLCLRDCFVRDRYHYGGRTYDLPDGFPISPKNFKPMDAPVEVPQPSVAAPLAVQEQPKPAPVKVRRKSRRTAKTTK